MFLTNWWFDIKWASAKAWETITWPACFTVLSINIEILSWHIYHLRKNSLPAIAVALWSAVLVSYPSIFVRLSWVIAPNIEAIKITSCWMFPSVPSSDFFYMFVEWIHCLVHSHVTAPQVVCSIVDYDPTISNI